MSFRGRGGGRGGRGGFGRGGRGGGRGGYVQQGPPDQVIGMLYVLILLARTNVLCT